MTVIRFIFDLDGTMTQKETLPLIAEKFGVKDEIAALTKETIEGNIPFTESFIRRVHILGALSVSQIDSLLAEVPIYPKVHEFISNHQENCVIATGNLGCWISGLIKRIGITCYSSEGEVANDKIARLVTIVKKEDIVKKYQAMGDKVVFIGDGNNDLEAMRLADISIASGLTHKPASSILTVADYLFFHEDALCRQLHQLCYAALE